MHRITKLLHDFEKPKTYHGAVIPPMMPSSQISYDTLVDLEDSIQDEGLLESISMNHTIDILEKKLAQLELGESCRCFGTSHAALTAAVFSLVKSGDHVISIKDVKIQSYEFFNWLTTNCGVKVSFIEGLSEKELVSEIKYNTKLIYLESPTSFLCNILDLKRISEIAHSYEICTILDNTCVTPWFQNPLDFGIDLVVHSLGAFLNGHQDTNGGAIIGSKEMIAKIETTDSIIGGSPLAPMEAWFILRGLRSLRVRMERHQRSAKEICTLLEKHPEVERVYYPEAESFSQPDLAKRYLKGSSGVITFSLKDGERSVVKLLNSLNKIRIGFYIGGDTTTIMSPKAYRQSVWERENIHWEDIGGKLVRLSVGLEPTEEIKQDLLQALNKLNNI